MTGRKPMRKFAIHLLLLASCTAQLLMAQQSGQTLDRPAQPGFIFGDDGDQVQIVPKEDPAAASSLPKKNHGGAAMKAIQQVPIFWGKGWAESDARAPDRTRRRAGRQRFHFRRITKPRDQNFTRRS